MAWDTEGTKRKILDAATELFVVVGPAGTTIEQIARSAGVNKERIYNYFGGKDLLFEHVLREQLASAMDTVPVPSSDARAVGDYAGRLFDYLLEHPQLLRLLEWEALVIPDAVPDESHRRDRYDERTSQLAAGQASGALGSTIDPDLLNLLILAMVSHFMILPQVARMITGVDTPGPAEQARRRRAVVEAVTLMAAPAGALRADCGN